MLYMKCSNVRSRDMDPEGRGGEINRVSREIDMEEATGYKLAE